MKIQKAFDVGEGHGKLWFMSDLHYNHENVIKFNKRGFPGVMEMNNWIEKELMEKVGPEDILFDLGDLFWKTSETKMKKVIELASPKEWHKILGNHDKFDVYRKSFVGSMFTTLSDILDINVNYQGRNYKMVLSHYPMISWNGKARGTWMIHGHTHGNIDDLNEKSPDLRVDIGFDSSISKAKGSFLLSFEDLFDYMTKKANGTDYMEYVQKNCKAL